MRLQVREAHFLEMIVVLALLNSLGKDRAYPRLSISCPSPTPTPKSHSNDYSTPHSKALVFHASQTCGWSLLGRVKVLLCHFQMAFFMTYWTTGWLCIRVIENGRRASVKSLL